MTKFYAILRWLFRVFFTLIYPVKAVGVENIPAEGGVILCSNHLSMLDPFALIAFAPRAIRFMAKAELFDNRLFAWALTKMGAFSIKRGESDLASVRLALQVLKDENVFGIFPEGHRKDAEEEHVIHTGASMIALRSGAATVPVCISGKWRPFHRTTIRFNPPVDLSDLKPVNVVNMEVATQRITKAIWKD